MKPKLWAKHRAPSTEDPATERRSRVLMQGWAIGGSITAAVIGITTNGDLLVALLPISFWLGLLQIGSL